MTEFAPDQDVVLQRYNTAAYHMNELANAAGRLGVAGAEGAATQVAEQEACYRQLAEAQLDLPTRDEVEAQKADAQTDLEETQALRVALFGPLTSPSVEDGMLAKMITNITGQAPSGEAVATEVMSRLRALEKRAATLQASIRRLGTTAVYMAEGGVNVSSVPAVRRAEIEAEVREARRVALEEQARRQAKAEADEPVDRPFTGALALIASGGFPMTIRELAESIYGSVSDSNYVMARQMAADAVNGKGEMSRALQARGYQLRRVEVENSNAGEGKRGRKSLVAYHIAPLDPEE